MAEPSSSFSLRDRIVLSMVVTGIVGGYAYGTMWSVAFSGAAWAGLAIFASLWIAALWLIWGVR